MKLSPALIPRVAERFAALADENRLRLLLRLKDGPANVSSLCRDLEIAQASVSKHLAVLRRAGLVDSSSVGAATFYRIRDEGVFDMCQIVCDGVVNQLRQDQQVLRQAIGASRHR